MHFFSGQEHEVGEHLGQLVHLVLHLSDIDDNYWLEERVGDACDVTFVGSNEGETIGVGVDAVVLLEPRNAPLDVL